MKIEILEIKKRYKSSYCSVCREKITGGYRIVLYKDIELSPSSNPSRYSFHPNCFVEFFENCIKEIQSKI